MEVVERTLNGLCERLLEALLQRACLAQNRLQDGIKEARSATLRLDHS